MGSLVEAECAREEHHRDNMESRNPSQTKGIVQEHHRNSCNFLIAAKGRILVPKLCHKVFQVVVPLLFPEANAR